MSLRDVNPQAAADLAGVLEGLLNIVSGLTVHIEGQDEVIEELAAACDPDFDLVEPEDLFEDLDRLLISGQTLVHKLREAASQAPQDAA